MQKVCVYTNITMKCVHMYVLCVVYRHDTQRYGEYLCTHDMFI